MGRWSKVGVVIAGYVAAVVAGVMAGWLYDARLEAMPYDTSGGMYAAGVMMASLGVFLVLSLAPTLLALWFLRPHTRFWNALAVSSIAFALAGLAAVLAPLVVRQPPQNIGLMLLSMLGLSQLLGVPLWLGAFMLFAFIAPTRQVRRKLVLAVAVEVVIGACAALHWFVPRAPF